MRAVRFHDYGPPSALTVDELPDPTPGPGEVLIEVTAAGINFSDVQLRAGALRQWAPGLPLPFTPGHEVAGTVIATGPGADPALAGRRVIALSPAGGGYAELATVPEAAVLPAPDLGEHEALAVLTQGTTAVGLMAEAAVSPGETVLVEAATGGVGGLLVQLAKHAGATVVAAVGDEKKAAIARELGADRTVDLTAADDVGPVQVVFESVGGPLTRTALDLLEPTTGRMVLYGNLSGLPHEIDPRSFTSAPCPSSPSPRPSCRPNGWPRCATGRSPWPRRVSCGPASAPYAPSPRPPPSTRPWRTAPPRARTSSSPEPRVLRRPPRRRTG